MMIWGLILGFTGLVLAALVLGMAARSGDDRRRIALETQLLREQLGEIDAALANASLDQREAGAARREVERRALSVARATPQHWRKGGGAVALGLTGLLLAGGLALYRLAGHSELESAPQPARNLGGIAMVAPATSMDAAGWYNHGVALYQKGEARAAFTAFARAAKRAPGNVDAWIAQGQALLALGDGRVSPAATLAFLEVERRDPNHPAPAYYRGLAAHQAGKPEAARQIWQALLARASEDAPWRDGVERALARLDQPDPDEVAAMTEAERGAFIRSMVARLEARLQAQPDDVAGWLRLAQARAVLGEPDAALAALDQAQAHAGEQSKAAIADLRAKLVDGQ